MAKLPVVKVRSRGRKESPSVGELPVKVRERMAEQKELMLFHLSRSNGNVVYACKKVGVSRMTHYRWLASDAVYAESVNDIAEAVVDNMEALFIRTTVEEKDLRSMRWFLERRGKDRGYGKPTVMALDAEGNPIGYGSVQNNVQINFKSDVPADSLRLALSDLLKQNPMLLESPERTAQVIEVEEEE